MKLYHYDHCPYCVKARMIFGLKTVPVTLVPLLNDDVATPTQLIGQKMVPILEKDDGSAMPESMDIIHFIDGAYGEKIVTQPNDPAMMVWLERLRAYANKLTMPRWVATDLPEFATESARRYFQQKKEAMIGAFAEHLARTAEYLTQAHVDLQALVPLIERRNAQCPAVGEDDFHLFAALRGLTIVQGIQLPAPVEHWLHCISERSNIELYTELAS